MMSVVLNLVALWLGILFCSPKPVTAIPAFNSTPQSPSYAVEGQNITLEWTFMLDGTLGLIQFFNVTDSIGSSFGPGTIAVMQKYQARFSGQANNTRAEMTILEVKRSDESSYRVNVISSSNKAFGHDVKVVVLYHASITSISVHQTAKVGDLVWLNCTAVGLPEPSITWTILSTKRNVSMPLNITRKQDEGFYRCTADNGIGNPATADVFITVYYKPDRVSLKISTKKVCAGTVVTFTCLAGAANPAIQNYILHVNNGSGLVIVSSNQLGVFTRPLYTEGQHTYTCEVSNSVGRTSSSSGTVDVRARASVTIANETIVVLEGGNITLRCGFCGSPLPNVSWINSSLGYTVNTEIILNLPNISRYSGGVYTCLASNACGSDSKDVYVDVQYPVKATGDGEIAKVAEGGAQTFVCPVDGNPEPNIEWYSKKTGKKISSGKQYETGESGCYFCVASNYLGSPVNITQCLTVDPNLTLPPTTTVPQQSTTSAPSTTKATSAEPEGSVDTPWVIIGGATGGVVVLAIGVGVLTWWVHKKRKCIKDSKIHNSDMERHDGAYAQSGPPAANGTDGAADQQIEAEAAIPTYAAVDKSKKSKKQADERPPEYAVVDKSRKTEKREAAAIPTYAAVDKSKKKKKSREEVPAVYAEVDKSKKKKKKKIDDKNLYENLDEPKKEKKPGELLYADLGEFQNPSMPAVSISPQPLPAIKKADPYERTDYADITQFLKGNATLPPNDGNGDTEMKPKRPSKKQIQGNDKETPI